MVWAHVQEISSRALRDATRQYEIRYLAIYISTKLKIPCMNKLK